MFERQFLKKKRGKRAARGSRRFLKSFKLYYSLSISIYLKTIKFISVVLLTFVLTVSWGSVAFGQLPFFPTVESSQKEEPIFDWFNRSYQCGNLQCSNVWFNGTPLLTVASLDENTDISVEQRAKKIEINLQQILKATLQYSETEPEPRQTTGDANSNPEGEGTIVPEPLELIKNRPTVLAEVEKSALEPSTPQIEVGTLNNQTVIFVPKQPGIPQQSLLTVTESDAIANFKSTPEELALAWRDGLREGFSNAIEERQKISQKPLQRPLIILAIAAVVITCSFVLFWVQKRSSDKERKLKNKLNDFKKILAAESESVASENAIKSKGKVTKKNGLVSPKKGRVSQSLLLALSETNLAFVSEIAGILETLPDVSLKKQTRLKQQRNATVMLQLVLLWLQVLLWIGGVGLIFAIYPYTRAFTVFIWTQSIYLLAILLFASLADKGSNFLVDFWLEKWAEKAREASSYPQRYTKRVATYSEALTQATTFIVYLVAIALTIQALGFSLAGAGVLGIAATYVFKPKVDNVINGVLILWSDRYAVGDVIQVGNHSGLVENMSLYITELRGDLGRLITIPNSYIDIVENLTKEWSRVELKIELAYDTDVERALQLLKTVAEEMQKEPEWDEKILKPASIFGLDDVSYDGLLVQVLIDTAPMQQWSVARELRIRIKQAFDREGIALGMPRRSLYLHNSQEKAIPTGGDATKGDRDPS